MANCPKKGRHSSLFILLYIWVKRRVNVPEIVQTFHLCTCNLPNVIQQSNRDTFSWQLSKKRLEKLTLNTSIYLNQMASKWPWNPANLRLVYMQSSKCIEQSTRDTFRWQLSKKRTGKLTLDTTIHLSQTASKWPWNCANFPLVYMQSSKCNTAKY